MQEKEPQYINSIIRATAILELYEKLNVQYLGIAEISKELGIQKTTVFNNCKNTGASGMADSGQSERKIPAWDQNSQGIHDDHAEYHDGRTHRKGNEAPER